MIETESVTATSADPETLSPAAVLNFRWTGVLLAGLIGGAWLVLVVTGVGWFPLGWTTVPLAVVWVAASTFLYTGLFITAHDAMHGILAPKDRWLNDLLGRLAVFAYALFPYGKLYAAHHEHHRHPASADDPDFHPKGWTGFWPWYFGFMFHYSTPLQFGGMAAVFHLLWLGLGLPIGNVLVFWVLPAVLSSLQLFYFGTYLPHRELQQADQGYLDAHHARSNAYPEWLSLLTCYHFGYHWEHHQWPFVPWWRLPAARRYRLRGSKA